MGMFKSIISETNNVLDGQFGPNVAPLVIWGYNNYNGWAYDESTKQWYQNASTGPPLRTRHRFCLSEKEERMREEECGGRKEVTSIDGVSRVWSTQSVDVSLRPIQPRNVQRRFAFPPKQRKRNLHAELPQRYELILKKFEREAGLSMDFV
jgi:hypothetical protein